MIRALLRLVLVVVILATAAAFFLGYRIADTGLWSSASAQTPTIDAEKARQTGAAVGEKVATGAAKAEHVLSDGGLSAQITTTMALDDIVRARTITVTVRDSVATLSGTVQSEIERATALELARDTVGVTGVTDQMVLR